LEIHEAWGEAGCLGRGVVQVGAEARSVHELAPVSRFCCELRYAFAKVLVATAPWQGGGDRVVCRGGGRTREPL
ncbi:MAG: hypothetical protein AAB254_04005, partial [candidate division NC10 bacterium]